MNEDTREKLFSSASMLFYHKGYHRTSLDAVLAAANVSEAEFRQCYASLDELHQEYLMHFNDIEGKEILAHVERQDTPLVRFMAVIEAIRPWMVDRSFRGCVYVNAISEFPDPESMPRRVGRMHYDALREVIRKLTADLKNSDCGKYTHLDVVGVSEEYMMILIGTITTGSIYSSDKCMNSAVRSVRRLLLPVDTPEARRGPHPDHSPDHGPESRPGGLPPG